MVPDSHQHVGPKLYEERVAVPVLESPHASAQLLERIAWAVADAEAAEGTSRLGDMPRHDARDPAAHDDATHR